MAENILLDTSVLIDIFDHNKYPEILEKGCQISIVSIYEYIRYKKMKKEAKILLEDAFDTFNFSNPIILRASEIFAKLKENGITINENDVYIAATAMVNNAILYTVDKDFSKIKQLFADFEVKVLK